MIFQINHNPNKNRKILIVFDDMVADMKANKKFQSIVKELFIRCRNLNYLLYFPVPKDFRLNSTHYLILKIHNKRELQNIAINHSADIDYKDFMNIYRKNSRSHILSLPFIRHCRLMIHYALEEIF